MASWVSSAVWAAASCVGSIVVEKLVDMGLNSILSKLTLQVDSEAALKRVQAALPGDSEAALKRIQAALPQIRAIMGVAEALKMEDPSSREWVHRFREAVDAAEDVIDELEYKKLEDEVVRSSSGSKKRKRTGAISDDILERLNNAVTMLDEAAAGVKDLLQRADRLGIRYLPESQFKVCRNLRRETTSLLAERKVFGREVEKADIIGWLTRETDAPLSSFGIVGVGGLGKTTLAQSVNQELSGSGYFEKIIWVCVSNEFSVEGITKNILAGIGGGCHGDNPLDVLQQNLKEKIQSSKKVLLILDDVWEDGKREDWEQLVAPLRFAQKGSKILFTTRQQSVAYLLDSVINTEHESLALKNLEEKELRSLFDSYAFHGFNPNQYEDLQVMGDQIVKKLHGSPLAAKVIGSLLNSRMDSVYWRRISNDDSLINLEQANGVMDVLKLSYYNLPADLQLCFRFCSIFPQDHEFDKRELIEMWMASGFIQKQSCEERRPEDIGEDYFNLLLKKSFFEIYINLWSQERYVMHDLIHELAQNVSNGECCRVAPSDESVAIPSTVRHVSVHEGEIQKVFHLENIRSLVITTYKQQYETKGNIFVLPKNLIKKSLRLLKIKASGSYKLPEEMSCLVHLRYLSIELNWVNQLFMYLLPDSIYKLYHLLVLKFKDVKHPDYGNYSRIETAGMANLVSLRYMTLRDEIMKTICGVHRMTSLQELTFFVGKESGYRINELRTVNNLRRLKLCNIENIGDPAEARSANLLAKKNLESLSLECSIGSNLENLEQIFDNLRPHQNLMELVIENYKGRISPVWVRDMPYLKILHIFECLNLVQLPDMFPFLTEFRVDGVGLTSLPNIGVNTSTPSSQKSSLREVEILNCPNLISLNGFLQQGNLKLQGLEELTIRGCENLAQLPMHAFRTTVSLKHLTIRDCPNLTGLFCLPLSLVRFLISSIAVSALPEYFESPGSSGGPSPSSFTSSLRNVYIDNCPNLTALNGFFQQGNLELQDLEELTIRGCENLAQLPMHAFRTTMSLKHLTIENCPNLTGLPCLPLSLIEFLISSIAISALPEYFESSSSSGGLSPSSFTSSLGKVSINNCPNLIALNGFLQQSNLELQDLEELTIQGCENLAQLPMHAFKTIVSLKFLTIEDCPNLIGLPCLPLSLIEFLISSIAVNALPEYFESPGSSGGPSPSSFTSSLAEVQINNCPNLTALNGFLQQDNIYFRAINSIYVSGCENLIRIPMGAFLKFESLTNLTIKNCPKLMAVNNQNNLLPPKLEWLTIENCGEFDVPLLESSSRLTTLTYLSIINSANITRIPFAENVFGSLYFLEIQGCPKLVELSLMQQAHNVDLGSNVASLKIKELHIDELSLLLIEPLRNLRFVSELRVSNCSKMEALPEQWLLQNSSTLRRLAIWNASTLQSLPATMERLTALQYLRIFHADLLVELPDLPASLKVRIIKSSDGVDKFLELFIP